MQLPQVRSVGLGIAQFGTGIVAAIAFMSSKSVDLYAAWDQFYTGFKLILGAWAIAGPIAIGAITVYFSSTQRKLAEVMQDPAAPKVAQALPVTPAATAVADALKKAP